MIHGILSALLAAAVPCPVAQEQTRPNIVLIVWDDLCTERDLAPTSDYPAPTLRSLASGAAYFSRAVAPVQAGRPRRAALLSGLYPHQNGVFVHAGPPVELEQSLPQVLRAAGYATLAVGRFEGSNGNSAGFTSVCGDLARAATGAQQFVQEQADGAPLFVWWAPEAPRGKKKDALTAMDAALSALVGALEKQGSLANTLFAFVTDSDPRGGAFEVNDVVGDRALRPVFLSFPARISAGRFEECISLLDLYPTLLEYAGQSAGRDRSGRSVRPLLAGESLPDRELCGAYFGKASSPGRRGAPQLEALTIRSSRWEYVLLTEDRNQAGGTPQVFELMRAGDQALYDLQADSGAWTNLVYEIEHEATAVEQRTALLRWWKESSAEPFEAPYVPPPLGPAPKSRPNVVLVIADDMDFENLGFMGNALVRTPNLDALADQGVVFPVCHAPMSVCRPTHAALLSGRWPHQTGIYDNDVKGYLERRESLPSQLKAAGYATFMAGKLWEGPPQPLGFLEPEVKNDAFVRAGQEQLFDFIDRYAAERPLFIWWAPWLPHVPHNPPQHLVDLLGDTDIPVPETVVGDPDDYRAAERKAYAMGAWFDEGLGQLRAKLEEAKVLENTLFVFLIDNGRANGFPSKGTAYEKGLRTPVVFSWPKGFAGGRTEARLLSVVDIPATILELAGAAPQPRAEGVSQASLLRGASAGGPEREYLCGVVYRAVNLVGHGTPESDAIALHARDQRWKFVLYLVRHDVDRDVGLKAEFAELPLRKRGDRDLFDLLADPHERNDLAGDPAHAQRLRELEEACLTWWKESGGGRLDLP